jgi:hypothetical protein
MNISVFIITNFVVVILKLPLGKGRINRVEKIYSGCQEFPRNDYHDNGGKSIQKPSAK